MNADTRVIYDICPGCRTTITAERTFGTFDAMKTLKRKVKLHSSTCAKYRNWKNMRTPS
jgi:hypothetical protein